MIILLNSTTTDFFQRTNLKPHLEILHPKHNSDNYRGHIESGYTLGRPLVGIIILASLFLCTLIGALLVILIFCKKKNTVFVLPKSTLSDAWRSSMEMNSLHSGSVSEVAGDWLMFCNGKKYPNGSSSRLHDNLQNYHNTNMPMSVESAFLLHLLGSSKNIDSKAKASRRVSNVDNFPRSHSCHSNFAFKLPSLSALKRAVSKRSTKLPISKTYERLGDPDEYDRSLTNDIIYSNPNREDSIIDMYGCAVSRRPWLAKGLLNQNQLPPDYSNLRVHINRYNYGVRQVSLSK